MNECMISDQIPNLNRNAFA